jgi:DNA polymerase-3 subunit gamma/tau
MSSYLVIARKWRPTLFEEIVGQDHVTRTLVNAINSDRVAHAYLFSGPRGVGKTTTARILAKGLNCSNGPTSTPCNECGACTSIANGSSVDVFEIDGASNTSVDNVRELRESVRFMPSQGRFKVYIIDEVHMLSTSAFNALLKTLEEPPPHAVFIFATTEMHKIPLTILSRCQHFDFKRIPLREIETHLRKIVTEEGIAVTDDALFAIAREADGSLRDAQSLLDQVLAFADGEITGADISEALGLMGPSILFELLEAVVARDGLKGLNVVEKIYNFGYDLKRACSELLGALRDLTVIKVTELEGGAIDAGVLELSDHEFESMRALAEKAGVERLHMLFSIMSGGYEEVSRSAYPRYSFEMALLRAMHFDEVGNVAGLVERLDRLGAGLDRAGLSRADLPQGENGRKSSADMVRSGPIEAAPAPDGGVRAEQTALADAPPVKKEEAPTAVEAMAAETESVYPADGAQGGPPGTDGLVDHLGRGIPSLAGRLKLAEIKVGGKVVDITVNAEALIAFEMKDTRIKNLCEGYLNVDSIKLRISALDGPQAGKEERPDPQVEWAQRIFGGKVIEDGGRTNV